jgi:hypothetical protein
MKLKKLALAVAAALAAPLRAYHDNHLALFAVVNVKSASVTNMDASPPVKVASYLDHGKVRSSVGLAEAANGDSIGSTYRLARVHSSWRPRTLLLFCDAITSGAADIGLYDINSAGGAVISATCFATAQSIASAITLGTNVKYEALNIDQAEKTYWEIAGLTTDPSKLMDVVLTLTAATTAAGTLVLEVESIET